MINETVLRKLQATNMERQQQTDAKKRLHNLADRILHIPRAPDQKIYSKADPRKAKLQRQEGDTDEQDKLRQFANVADEVDKEEKMEHLKRELLVLKNPEIEGENQPRIEPRPLIRPYSACAAISAAQLAKTQVSMTARMRTANLQNDNIVDRNNNNNNNNVADDRRQQEMTSLSFAPSSSFSINNVNINNNKVRPQYSSTIIKPRRRTLARGKSSVSSPPSAFGTATTTNQQNSSVIPNRSRGRMFSTIEIVQADDEDYDEDSPFSRSTSSATRRKSTTISAAPQQESGEEQQQQQRASFGCQNPKQIQKDSETKNDDFSSSLANQRKSVVSGIFRRPEDDANNKKIKVLCHGDVRLKIVERQWNFSPHRKFPKNWQPDQGEDEEEENDDDDDDEERLNDTLDDEFGVFEAKKLRKRNKQMKKEEEPELKLQCVLEWEMEQAKDARELAVTFTERFLKVKDGSCRPLLSQFSALAKEELKRKTGEDDDTTSGRDDDDDEALFSKTNAASSSANILVSSSPSFNPSSPKRIMSKLTKKKDGNNNSPSHHNKISRLPRSSWHVDFAVQEPEKETWKWFTKKLYNEANMIGSETVRSESLVIDYENNNFSASLLKNITFSGCCKGFNTKQLKIPDPPSIEQQLKAQTQKEEDLSEKLARKDSKVFLQQQQKKEAAANTLAEFLPVISTTDDEDFSIFDKIQRQRKSVSNAAHQLPPSLLKAESFRKGESFRLSAGNSLRRSFIFNNSSSNNNSMDRDSPEPEKTNLLSSVARFRSRRFDQANFTTKLSEEEKEMQRKVEEARRAREAERLRRKVLKLESMSFLQCILDRSSSFFKDLATQDRLSVSEIRLEHCKLPRIKTQEEIEAERLYKEMQQRFKDHPHRQHLTTETGEENNEGEESHHKTNPFSSSFVDALEEEEEDQNEESLTGTTTNTTSAATPQNLSHNMTPQSKTHNSTTNITPASASLTATMASRGGVISPFHRNLPLSSLLTPKQNRLKLEKDKKVDQQHQSEDSMSTSRRNSLANSSTGTAVPNDEKLKTSKKSVEVLVKPLRVAFIDAEQQQQQQQNPQQIRGERKHSPSSSSSENEDDAQKRHDSFCDLEEDFADAFLNRFVLSHSKTLRVLSLHGTRLTQKFIQKLALVIRSKELEKLEHLDIGLCGIESIDETPYTSKVMASAIAHASPSLRLLSLNGTALSPNFVGVAFCAAVRTNVNLRKVDCVGCDRGGTKFEAIIQQMLKERNEEYDRLEKARLIKVNNEWMTKVNATRRSVSSASSLSAIDDDDDDDEDFNASAMLQPSKSVKLIDDFVLL